MVDGETSRVVCIGCGRATGRGHAPSCPSLEDLERLFMQTCGLSVAAELLTWNEHLQEETRGDDS